MAEPAARLGTGSAPPARGLRVLHAPVNVANQPWVLSRNERALGARSDLVVNYDTWLQLHADRVLGEYGKRDLRSLARRARAGLAAPFRYDVLHYYFGRSLLGWDDWARGPRFPFLDLKLAKALGKRVFMTLQGCDIRLAEESHARNAHTPCASGACGFYAGCLERVDAERRALARDVLPLCDKVYYLNPELGFYTGCGEFLPYASVEIADLAVVPPATSGRLRIVHAPSDPAVKGTQRILAALDSLAGEFDFELVLVQGKTHAEALALYRSADLAIDQVLAGWYGGFAVEMMALGKPVLCYLRESDLVHVPAQMIADLPIANLRPDHLRDDLAAALARRAEYGAWSARSRAYVEKWHDPRRIAAALLRQYAAPATPLAQHLVSA